VEDVEDVERFDGWCSEESSQEIEGDLALFGNTVAGFSKEVVGLVAYLGL